VTLEAGDGAKLSADPCLTDGEALAATVAAWAEEDRLAPSPASQARDLAWLWEQHLTRWQAALAPPWPDPELLSLAADEVDRFTQVIDLVGPPGLGTARDDAWEAVDAAAETFGVYADAARVVATCESARIPTCLDSLAFPGLAISCRAALRHAAGSITRLTTALEARS